MVTLLIVTGAAVAATIVGDVLRRTGAPPGSRSCCRAAP